MPKNSSDSVTNARIRRPAARLALRPTVVGLLLLGACVRNSAVGPPGGGPGSGAPGAAAAVTTAGEMQRLYRGMGLVAGSGPLSFVASVSFLSAPTRDTTLVLLALSMPSRALAFTREGERYAAEYSTRVEVRQGPVLAADVSARETVRVPTYRETSRTDESIIWQQYLRLAPGRYTLTIAIKDENGLRNTAEEVALEVPPLAAGAVGTPIAVYEAIPRTSVDSIPRLLARPRSTVTFGADSLIPVYLEAVGENAPATVDVRVLGEGDMELWKSNVELTQRLGVRSATIAIPVTRLGVGVSNVVVSAPGRADTARTRILVSLGDDLPIATFSEMLDFLRYFTTADRLKPLRDAALTERSEAWAAFLKSTDPLPNTPEHEGLRDYFLRIRTANLRFRDDGPIGWQTDRGTAFVALGDPDNIYDSGLQDPNARVRQQVWEYRTLRVQLVFLDQTGFGRWRLNTNGRAELDNAIRRKLAMQQP